MIYDRLLTAGFSEDDCVEGVFLIEAVAEDTFHNRKRRLEEITGFSDGMFDSFEEDEEGGVWKTITTAYFDDVASIKKAVDKMKQYKWLFLSDSYILFEGTYLFSDGKWLI
jgi:hypothetical protein